MFAVVPVKSRLTDSVPRAGAPITIVLADDHALVRRSLRALLDREADLRVVAETSDLTTTARQVRIRRPRVLVVDLGMADGSTMGAIGHLRAQVPGTAVVVVTMQDGSAFVRGSLGAGAAGYVLKEHAAHELPPAVRAAAAGRRYVSAALGPYAPASPPGARRS